MKQVTIIVIYLLSAFIAKSQDDFKQNIRGTVFDKQTKYPLTGATVIIQDSDPLIGTITDLHGQFVLSNIASGRISLEISYMGYSPASLNKLMLSSGKELVVEIGLEENVYTTEEAVITAEIKKDEALNKMATVSARSFSIEETNKYAGSLGDPARMAANFAGVLTANDSRNDIIIRGNSPLGVLWRLDGVEIPNPNHFGAMGTTGGPVSMLNNNLLTNSDFMTAAFPSEFGNATAGVFDLKLRSGNNQQREYTLQMGFNGFELGAEGPFSKNKQASFLANYRYSMPAIFDKIGFSGTAQGSSVPYYQDLSFKIDIPGMKYGRFELFGLAGFSTIKIYDTEKDSSEFSYGLNGTNTDFGSQMGVIALTHNYFFNKKTHLFSTLSATHSRSYTYIDSITKSVTDSIYPWLRTDFAEMKYSASSRISHKSNAKNYFVGGLNIDFYLPNYHDSVWIFEENKFRKLMDTKGKLYMGRAYVQWQHKFSDQFSFNSGAHFSFVGLNNEFAIEPRGGLKWKYHPNQSLSFGAGLHSQTQPRINYFTIQEQPDGEFVYTNKNLKMSKSAHFVLGHDISLKGYFRLKTEVYYQHLYNIPVSSEYTSFSMLNEGAYFAISMIDSLENKGTGINYGAEITLEKFLSNGYYFLVTASLFESNYTAFDGKVRNTAFNGNYVLNALCGYEFKLGSHAYLSFDLKTVWGGGKRYTPINVNESILKGTTVYYEDQINAKKHDDYFKIDARISFRKNGKKVNQEWALDIKNISNHRNIFIQSFDTYEGQIHTDYQEGFYPMFLYRLNF